MELPTRLGAPLPAARSIDVDGIRTCYYDVGSGPTILCVYGGNFGTAESASSAYTWNLQLASLAGRFRVIAVDKLGQGLTDNPPGDDYTMHAVVQHLAGFIRAMALPPIHIVGHSRGGYAVTRLTLERPALVRSVTVINSGTLSIGVGTNDVVLARPPHPRGTRECVRWVYENYSFNPRIVDDGWVDAVMETLALPKYQESIRKMETEGLGARLFAPQLAQEKRETLAWIADGRFQRPLQLIWGFNDRTAVVERGIELFQLFAKHERRTELHVINESGHFPFREHPARFDALLANFVIANER